MYKLPIKSIVVTHGLLNSTSPLPLLSKHCIKRPLVSNIETPLG